MGMYNSACMKEAVKKINEDPFCFAVNDEIIDFLRENKLIAIYIEEDMAANLVVSFFGLTGNYNYFNDKNYVYIYYDKNDIYINKNGAFFDCRHRHIHTKDIDDNSLVAALDIAILHSDKIRVVYDENHSPHWQFETDLPHETFNIMSDDEEMPEDDVFCEGIVLEAWRLKS